MRASKVKTKPGIVRNIRTVKIQPKHRINTLTQTINREINLYGSLLEHLGFHCGQKVTVDGMKNRLVIRLQTV